MTRSFIFADASRRFVRGWSRSLRRNNNVLAVNANPTAPIESNFRVALNRATINQVYDKFAKSRARTSTKKLVNTFPKREPILIVPETPTGVTNLEKKKLNEAAIRANGVVAQGDLENRKIDRLLLVDYDTEAVFWNWIPMFRPSKLRRGGFLLDWSPEFQQRCRPPKRRSTLQPSPPRNQGFSESIYGRRHNRKCRRSASNPQPLQTSLHPVCSSLASDSGGDRHRTTPQYPREHELVIFRRRCPSCDYRQGRLHFGASGLSRDDLLARSALAAVRQWRYKQCYLWRTREVDTTITITFALLN